MAMLPFLLLRILTATPSTLQNHHYKRKGSAKSTGLELLHQLPGWLLPPALYSASLLLHRSYLRSLLLGPPAVLPHDCGQFSFLNILATVMLVVFYFFSLLSSS